ncbi:Mce-associated membrane protein [Mycolicibacterium sp. BK634]|uniref:Mce protein n=1 Tax=Mycobacteriaceae TaxID=1762 RepID=UPI00105D10DB|nr:MULTISPECIES: Mce protein [Mycobacteriaceae]MBB3753227.1 Mce-associated membrane protein [Mycolicibacterium sp. BK634]TDO09010.1 Mce-associated membrane protein [Mycobacterium sp. BK086]
MADEPAAPEGEAATPDEVEATTETTETPDEAVLVAPAPGPKRSGGVLVALIIVTVVMVVLGGLTGWLGYRWYEAKEATQLRELLVGVGRQGAINLTTIHFDEADKDVQRILDSATDSFYDDFAKRSQPFIEVVKQAQSKSDGQVTEAGLESVSGNEGQVLVAVTVTTSNAGAANQPPRAWRMRLTVKKTGADEAKVSKVEFVP